MTDDGETVTMTTEELRAGGFPKDRRIVVIDDAGEPRLVISRQQGRLECDCGEAEQERAAIVAYMLDPARRAEYVMMGPRVVFAIAAAIDRGEHRK